MKRWFTLITIFIATVALVSCAAGRYPYPKKDLAMEHWHSEIDSNPDVWAARASDWFRIGQISQLQKDNEVAPLTDSMSRVAVKVADFNSIKLNGDFKVQITNASGNNKVIMVGPNEAIRSVKVSVNDETLCVEQIKNASPEVSRIIVYINIRNLHTLINEGAGDVEGIRLQGHDVAIEQGGSGNMYLAGRMNVSCITNRGSGCVTLYGDDLRGLEIKTSGTGNVNVYGTSQVDLKSIYHRGSGDINVINATSNCLKINTDGEGKIGLRGEMIVKEIEAGGKTCTFLTTVSGHQVVVHANNNAKVGMDGRADVLRVFTTRTSEFMGRCLLARELYATATGTSHINSVATGRAFASAKDYASIYFFGDPGILAPFESHSGTVITLDPSYYATYCEFVPEPRHRNYKDEMPRNYKDM